MEFKGDYGFLSTFYPCSIVLDKETLLKYSDDKLHDYINTYLPNGFQLSCVEQGFQALKADKVEEFIDILNTKKGYEKNKFHPEWISSTSHRVSVCTM